MCLIKLHSIYKIDLLKCYVKDRVTISLFNLLIFPTCRKYFIPITNGGSQLHPLDIYVLDRLKLTKLLSVSISERQPLTVNKERTLRRGTTSIKSRNQLQLIKATRGPEVTLTAYLLPTHKHFTILRMVKVFKRYICRLTEQN